MRASDADMRSWMTDTFATKIDLARAESRLVGWMLGVGVGLAGLTLAGVYFLLNHAVR